VYTYNIKCKANRYKTSEVQEMRVYGLDKIAREIEASNKMAEIHKKAIARRVKELTAQGVDKEIAKVMAEQGL